MLSFPSVGNKIVATALASKRGKNQITRIKMLSFLSYDAVPRAIQEAALGADLKEPESS